MLCKSCCRVCIADLAVFRLRWRSRARDRSGNNAGSLADRSHVANSHPHPVTHRNPDTCPAGLNTYAGGNRDPHGYARANTCANANQCIDSRTCAYSHARADGCPIANGNTRSGAIADAGVLVNLQSQR